MARSAWATFEIKAVDTAARRLEGIASTPELDRQGDRMDPAGATFRLPLPLLWQHRTDQPIGHVTAAGVTAAGIRMTAEIAKGVLPYIDDAWALIQAGLVRGLSIGWRPLADPIATKAGGWEWPKWEWLELSAVTIPANQSASIALIKSLDRDPPAAIGHARSSRTARRYGVSQHGAPMKVSEELTTARDLVATKSARLEALLTQAGQDGGLEADETAEQATLEGEIATTTARIKTLATLEAAYAAQATAVGYTPAAPAEPARAGAGRSIVTVPPLEKGTLFTRWAMSIAAGKGSISDAIQYARRWSSTPEVLAYVKAAATPGLPTAGNWGAALAAPNTMQTEFVELLRPETLIGRVPGGFYDVPFNIPIVVQSGGSLIAWVGAAALKPVSELAFTSATLTFSKVAGIVVLSDELIRLSTPAAETTVRNDLVAQAAKFLDEQFIHVGVAATAANPASITNGVTSIPATGTTYGALMKDLNTALATFDAAGIPTDGLVIATTPGLARGIATMTNPLGAIAFPSMSPNGGSLLGYPVLVSAAVEPGLVVIFKPKEIFMADDKTVTLDASNQATLDMDGVAGPTFNLWQKNCTAIRAEQWIRWQKRRVGVVAVISAAAYAPA